MESKGFFFCFFRLTFFSERIWRSPLWWGEHITNSNYDYSYKLADTYNPSKIIEWDLSKLLELLDTQVLGSVQWVLLEISWI